MTTITNDQVRSFQTSLQLRAEHILKEIGVQELSEDQIMNIHDSGEGAGKNVTSCNSDLVNLLEIKGPSAATSKRKTLKLITELNLIILCLTSIEGNGHIRFTESMASIFTDPSNFDSRSMRWEFGRLIVACGWFKSETTASEAALAVKRATLKVCTARTSSIFIRTALAVKPLEVRLVHSEHGEAAASVHWSAFGARNGTDMCSEPNLEWARRYFNRAATIHMSLTLQELRHVWIGIGRRVSDKYAFQADDELSRIIRNSSARQSHHSATCERRKYAGQEGSIMGHEPGDRKLYRALSENFNREVFGCGAASASASVQAPAPAPLPPVSALASAAASASAPRFPLSMGDHPPPLVASFLDPLLPVSASAPALISVAASAQQASALGQQPEIRNERTGRPAPVPCKDPRAVDWSDEAYARDTSFALRAIAQDFPGFQLGHKVPATESTPNKTFCPIEFRYTRGPNLGKIKFRVPLDIIDYGTSFVPFCTPEFLSSLSAEGHTRLMDTAALRECFRCLFLHLGVELGVHPVALQVVPRRP